MTNTEANNHSTHGQFNRKKELMGAQNTFEAVEGRYNAAREMITERIYPETNVVFSPASEPTACITKSIVFETKCTRFLKGCTDERCKCHANYLEYKEIEPEYKTAKEVYDKQVKIIKNSKLIPASKILNFQGTKNDEKSLKDRAGISVHLEYDRNLGNVKAGEKKMIPAKIYNAKYMVNTTKMNASVIEIYGNYYWFNTNFNADSFYTQHIAKKKSSKYDRFLWSLFSRRAQREFSGA